MTLLKERKSPLFFNMLISKAAPTHAMFLTGIHMFNRFFLSKLTVRAIKPEECGGVSSMPESLNDSLCQPYESVIERYSWRSH